MSKWTGRLILALATLVFIGLMVRIKAIEGGSIIFYCLALLLSWYNGKANAVIERLITGRQSDDQGRRKHDA